MSVSREGPSPGTPGAAPRKRRGRWLLIYLLLLLASHLFVAWRQPDPYGVNTPEDGSGTRMKLRVPEMSEAGVSGVGDETLSVLRFDPERAGTGLPILLLHGSPSGGGADFRTLAPVLADSGRTVYAVDFPGYGLSGQWVGDYSIKANARYVIAAMDALNLGRAHVVGWSQGGGSALWAADLSPGRVASLTLLGSIGVQEAEGSGSYSFEHVKYAVGWGLMVAGPEVVPHFGLLGPRHSRNAFIRNFMDSDQRELGPLMERLKVPTLIVHGRKDFLVPDWCAELSHRKIASSRLVMLDSNHFFPMGARKNIPAMRQAAGAMAAFFDRHDTEGVPALVGSSVFRPHESHIKSEVSGIDISRGMAWWAVILIICVGTLVLEDLTLVAVGILIVDGQIDPFVGLAGCFIGIVFGDMILWGLGRVLGRKLLRWRIVARFINEKSLARWGDMLDNHMGKAIFLCRCIPGTRMPTYIAAGMLGRKGGQFLFWEVIAVCVWAPGLLLLSALIGPKLLEFFRTVFHGPAAIVVALIAVFLIIRAVTTEATYEGRHRSKANAQRLWRYEFWPAWLFYLPMAPAIAWHALRRGPMTFTCANPGIENGGGMIGESKSLILRGLPDGSPERPLPPGVSVAAFEFIPAGPDAAVRAAVVTDAVRSNPGLGGYPVILKPDKGQRGHAVKLARNDDDVRVYFESMTQDAMVQRYVPGPYEIGLFWARVPAKDSRVDDLPGEIFSVTRKEFPALEGDGVRPLGHLIWEHPRYQMQAAVFIKRLESQLERIPAKGERIVLGLSGNHCQGAKFTDGSDLITPALARAIESICQGFRGYDGPAGSRGGRLDFGRFDMRFGSFEALERGEEFTIIELNGTSSESTNIYDPEKGLRWAYRVLRAQWSRAYALGAARRREGSRPMGLASLIAALKSYYRNLPGSAVSD